MAFMWTGLQDAVFDSAPVICKGWTFPVELWNMLGRCPVLKILGLRSSDDWPGLRSLTLTLMQYEAEHDLEALRAFVLAHTTIEHLAIHPRTWNRAPQHTLFAPTAFQSRLCGFVQISGQEQGIGGPVILGFEIAQFLLFELPLLGDPTPNKLEPRRAIVSLGLPELVEQLFHYAVTRNRKERWIRAASWLENTGQTMEELGLKRTVKGLWKTIAWYGSLRGFACIAVADLATFFSQDYFGGNLVDGMMDLLSIRLAESGGQSVTFLQLLFPDRDGLQPIAAHPGAQKYLKKYTSPCRNRGSGVKNLWGLAMAVASLNTVRRKGKVNIHTMELPEDEYIED
ncbi:hypothetical protein DFH09DRAFT_1439659 [Mycena vulgaris]|nr:hypothetical protein DFH09DRAFT_1439659 [Mycena vulgaris]